MLATTQSVIVREDRPGAGLLKNHPLAQASADGGCAELRRHLLDQAQWYGSRVLRASRGEPSRTTCSAGGWYDADLTLADRPCRCDCCGHSLDRDLTAAIHVSKLAGRSSARQHACGGASSGRRCEAAVQLTPVKQEPNTS